MTTFLVIFFFTLIICSVLALVIGAAKNGLRIGKMLRDYDR